jgi:hypothetical protein
MKPQPIVYFAFVQHGDEYLPVDADGCPRGEVASRWTPPANVRPVPEPAWVALEAAAPHGSIDSRPEGTP